MTMLQQGMQRFQAMTDWILSAFITLLLGGMVLLASAQIVMRNAFSYSLFWGDELLQLALLWLVMAGAVAAAHNGEHIRINVLERFCPRKARPWLEVVLHGFTSTVCGVLTWNSTRFVLDSASYGDTLLNDVPAWIAQVVIPIGFGLLSLHFAGRVSHGLHHASQRHSRKEDN